MTRTKTGGGVGTNQYQTKGLARRREPLMTVVNMLGRRLVPDWDATKPLPPLAEEGPWTGEARQAWIEICAERDTYRRKDLDRIREQDIARRQNDAQQIKTFGPHSIEFLASLTKAEEEDQFYITIDMTLSTVPELVAHHIAILAPQWPMTPHPYHRVIALMHPNYPGAILAQQVSDSVPEARWAIAGHPNCPLDTLAHLWADPHPSVRKAALDNPHTPEHIKAIVTLGDYQQTNG